MIRLETLDTLSHILIFDSQTLPPPEGQTTQLDVKSGLSQGFPLLSSLSLKRENTCNLGLFVHHKALGKGRLTVTYKLQTSTGQRQYDKANLPSLPADYYSWIPGVGHLSSSVLSEIMLLSKM